LGNHNSLFCSKEVNLKSKYCETVINTLHGNLYSHGGIHITTKYCVQLVWSVATPLPKPMCGVIP